MMIDSLDKKTLEINDQQKNEIKKLRINPQKLREDEEFENKL